MNNELLFLFVSGPLVNYLAFFILASTNFFCFTESMDHRGLGESIGLAWCLSLLLLCWRWWRLMLLLFFAVDVFVVVSLLSRFRASARADAANIYDERALLNAGFLSRVWFGRIRLDSIFPTYDSIWGGIRIKNAFEKKRLNDILISRGGREGEAAVKRERGTSLALFFLFVGNKRERKHPNKKFCNESDGVQAHAYLFLNYPPKIKIRVIDVISLKFSPEAPFF